MIRWSVSLWKERYKDNTPGHLVPQGRDGGVNESDASVAEFSASVFLDRLEYLIATLHYSSSIDRAELKCVRLLQKNVPLATPRPQSSSTGCRSSRWPCEVRGSVLRRTIYAIRSRHTSGRSRYVGLIAV